MKIEINEEITTATKTISVDLLQMLQDLALDQIKVKNEIKKNVKAYKIWLEKYQKEKKELELKDLKHQQEIGEIIRGRKTSIVEKLDIHLNNLLAEAFPGDFKLIKIKPTKKQKITTDEGFVCRRVIKQWNEEEKKMLKIDCKAEFQDQLSLDSHIASHVLNGEL